MKSVVLKSALGVSCFLVASLSVSILAAQAEPDDSKEVLRVLAYRSPGFFTVDDEGPAGVEYELLQYYADRHERELEIVWVEEFEDLIPRLLAGDGDLISATMTITPQRKRVIDFTTSYFPVQVRLVTRTDRPLADLSELEGERVGAVKGTTGEHALVSIAGTVVETNEALRELLERVVSGDLRAVATDTSIAFFYFLQMPQLDFGPELSEEQEYAFAVALGNEELRDSLSRHIKDLKLSRIFFRVLEKNLGTRAVTIVRAGKETAAE